MTRVYPFQTIWKYQLRLTLGVQETHIPERASFLRADMQGDEPYIWMLVDPAAKVETRSFFIRGTGYPIEADGEWLATFDHGPFVWHLFEALRSTP
jgi:hypothetical protein